LIDFERQKSLPAATVVQNLLKKIRPNLEQMGDWEEISTLAYSVLQAGNAAQRQKRVYAQTQSYEAVVDFLIDETAKGTAISRAGEVA
jgi:glutamate---cysteine ligase / carboxylate-amine ligase